MTDVAVDSRSLRICYSLCRKMRLESVVASHRRYVHGACSTSRISTERTQNFSCVVRPSDRYRRPRTGATRRDRLSIYAEEGIWYDAITTISEWIEANPRDNTLRLLRATLLDQVGLPAVADYDRRARR